MILHPIENPDALQESVQELLTAGVSGIDGRDNNGLQTGELSTSENQFFLSVANRFSEHIIDWYVSKVLSL